MNFVKAALFASMVMVVPSVSMARPRLNLPDSQSHKPIALDDMDRIQIHLVFQDAELTPAERLQKAYQIYQEARLKQIVPPLREKVRAKLEGFDVSYNNAVEWVSDENEIDLPVELKGTAAPYIILAHETEHRIQSATEIDTRPLGIHPILWDGVLDGRHLFRFETEAMQAEWEFLNVLPSGVVQDALVALKNPKLKGVLERGYLRRVFRHHDLSREEYVRAQRRTGRYSANMIASLVSENRAMLLLKSAMIAVPTCYYLLQYGWY